VLSYPSPARLAEHLRAAMEAPSPTPPRPAIAAGASGKDLDRLGGDELLALLDEELSLSKKRRATDR
jgi:hypothetical protein